MKEPYDYPLEDLNSALRAFESARWCVISGYVPGKREQVGFFGICRLTRAQGDITVAVYGITRALFCKWPEYTGCIDYPVPSQHDDVSAEAAFDYAFDTGRMWSGDYGAARMRLLEFCIKELREIL